MDVGCGKGFCVYEINRINPQIDVYGIDISKYAIRKAPREIKHKIIRGDMVKMPFPDNFFSCAFSLSAIYHLNHSDCEKAVREIMRVGKQCFIQVHSYRNEKEKENLTKYDANAETIMSTEEWKEFFLNIGYDGYYYWTIFL